jgi:hypothetical protein
LFRQVCNGSGDGVIDGAEFGMAMLFGKGILVKQFLEEVETFRSGVIGFQEPEDLVAGGAVEIIEKGRLDNDLLPFLPYIEKNFLYNVFGICPVGDMFIGEGKEL